MTLQPNAIVAIRHSFKGALEFLAEAKVNLPEHYVIGAGVHEEEGGDQFAQGAEPSTIATGWGDIRGKRREGQSSQVISGTLKQPPTRP